MLTSFSTLSAMALRGGPTTTPIPDAPIHFTFNTSTVSGVTVSSVGTLGSSMYVKMSPSASMLSTTKKEGDRSIVGWLPANTSYMAASDPGSFACYINNCSVSFWSTGADTNFATYFSIGTTGNPNFSLMANGATGMCVLYNGTQYNSSATPAVFSTSVFAHCVITITSAGQIKTFCNNVNVGTFSATPITAQQTALYFFKLLDNTRQYGGKLDCFRFYDKVLSTGEIQAIYTAGL